MSSFDAYHKWLGIPPEEQPPHHYRLLAIKPLESDMDVIEAAADRQMAYMRQLGSGEHTAQSQEILNQLAAARVCLLNPERKLAYDRKLADKLEAEEERHTETRKLRAVRKAESLAQAYPVAPPPAAAAAPTATSIRSTTSRPATSPGAKTTSLRKERVGNRTPVAIVTLAVVGLVGCAFVGWSLLRDGDSQIADVETAASRESANDAPGQERRPSEAQAVDSTSRQQQPSPAKVAETFTVSSASPSSADSPSAGERLAAEQGEPRGLVESAAASKAPDGNGRVGANGFDLPPGRASTLTPGENAQLAAFHDSSVVCQVLAAKRKPTGLVPWAVGFDGPLGNGRSGANGIYLPPGHVDTQHGTEWSFNYQRGGSARGVQMIHPLGDGHIVATVMTDGAGVIAGGWENYFVSHEGLEQRAQGYEAAFPFEPSEPHKLVSRLSADGRYALLLDGTPLITAHITEAPALHCEQFVGESLPATWPVGSAGLVVGPRDRGINQADQVVFRALNPDQTSGPAVAGTPAAPETTPETVSTKPGPPMPADPPATDDKTADDEKSTSKRIPMAVWEFYYGRQQTTPLAFYEDGTTSEGKPFTLSGNRVEFEAFGYAFVSIVAPDGLTCEAETRGGSHAAGRLMYRGIQPDMAPGVAWNTVLPQTELNQRLRGKLEETLPDVFEMIGSSRQKRRIHLSVVLTREGQVMERNHRLADWELKSGRVHLKFVDSQLGAADLSMKDLTEMAGRSESADGDDWSWSLRRVQLAAVWDTDKQGRLALYSNGRVNGGDLATGKGFWSLEDGKFQFWDFVCTTTPDGRSFTGRGRHGSSTTGRRLPNSVALEAK